MLSSEGTLRPGRSALALNVLPSELQRRSPIRGDGFFGEVQIMCIKAWTDDILEAAGAAAPRAWSLCSRCAASVQQCYQLQPVTHSEH
eukprot:19550-Heterococcus_DN1.PRE.3